MQSRLTLAEKVLILVAVPLIFELALVGGLSYLLHEADRERAREAHATDVSIELDGLLRLLLERSSSNVLRHITGSSEFDHAFKGTVTPLTEQVATLKAMCSSDPEEKKAVDMIEKISLQAD